MGMGPGAGQPQGGPDRMMMANRLAQFNPAGMGGGPRPMTPQIMQTQGAPAPGGPGAGKPQPQPMPPVEGGPGMVNSAPDLSGRAKGILGAGGPGADQWMNRHPQQPQPMPAIMPPQGQGRLMQGAPPVPPRRAPYV